MAEKWIAKAKLKKGALTNWVKRVVGEKGFDKNGNIKKDLLKYISKRKKIKGIKPSKLTAKRATVALTLRQYIKKKRKK